MHEIKCGKVSFVKIVKERNIVVKKFNRKEWMEYPKKVSYRGSLESCFMRELKCLQALQDHENFPNVIDFDKSRLSITMEYCGEHLDLTADISHYAPQIKAMVSMLENREILIDYRSNELNSADKSSRIKEFANFYNRILEKDGLIYFIDFETCVSTKLMEPEILTENLVQGCKRCNYNHLRSEMNAFIMGENRESLIKYMDKEKSKRERINIDENYKIIGKTDPSQSTLRNEDAFC